MSNVPETEVHRGLAGVYVDYTSISKVDPAANSLLYRGYPVQELAESCSFEEVAYLIWNGELPDAAELGSFQSKEREYRGLSQGTRQIIDALPTNAHPMDVLRTAVSALGANDESRTGTAQESTAEAELEKALLLLASVPSIVAYDQRRRRGLALVEPRTDLGFSANFLYQTFGEEADAEVVKAFDVSMILYAEHSFNASTFAARVITSTMADLYSAVVGAIGALKGSLHGGANEAVMHAFDEIGTGSGARERVKKWLDDALANKRKIMGFGHRVYKHGDSRVPTMRAVMEQMIVHYNRPDLLELYELLESEMTQRKGILPNLDYPAGPTYHLMGFDTATFTPLFVAARIVGWTAHIVEQQSANALIRPLSAYDGVELRHLGR